MKRTVVTTAIALLLGSCTLASAAYTRDATREYRIHPTDAWTVPANRAYRPSLGGPLSNRLAGQYDLLGLHCGGCAFGTGASPCGTATGGPSGGIN